jgi:hypothetical protein
MLVSTLPFFLQTRGGSAAVSQDTDWVIVEMNVHCGIFAIVVSADMSRRIVAYVKLLQGLDR